MPIYYKNKKTGIIEAKYIGCDTQSIRFRSELLYERLELDEDWPLQTTITVTPKKKPEYTLWQKLRNKLGRKKLHIS